MSDLRELYQELILDHGKHPRNFGAPEHADREAKGHNPLCGDRLTVYLVLDGDRIVDARFDGAGFGSAPDFRGAEFRGIARFDDALLPAGGDFRDLVCFGNAAFARAQGDDPDFTGSEFLGGFWAQSAQFGGAARFDGTQVHGRLWLRGALHGNRPLKAADFGMVFGYAWT